MHKTKALNYLIILRCLNAFPFMMFLASLNVLLTSSGFSFSNAADIVGLFFCIAFFLSTLSGYLMDAYINRHLFYQVANYCRVIALVMLFFVHQSMFILVALAIFLSNMSAEQVVVLSYINRLYQDDDHGRRYAMVWAYAATNIAAVGAFVVTFCFLSWQIPHLMYLTAAFFPLLSNYLYNCKFKQLVPNVYPNVAKHNILIIPLLLVAIMFFYMLFIYPTYARLILLLIFAAGVVYLFYKMSRSTQAHRFMKTGLFMLYYGVAVVYFSLFFLNTTLFYDLIPKVSSVKNAQILVLIDPVVAVVFFKLAHWLGAKLKNSSLKNYITSVFYVTGYIILLFAFLLLQHFFSNKMSFFIFLFYFALMTLGEIIIAPEGFSLAGRLFGKELDTYGVGLWRTFIGASFLLSTFYTDIILKDNILKRSYDFYHYGMLLLLVFVFGFSIFSIIGEKRIHKI